MSTTEKDLEVKCPECDAMINIPAGTEEGEIFECEECEVELEVTKIDGDKVTLEEAPEADEDWGE